MSWLLLVVEYILLACGIHPARCLLNKIRLRRECDPEEAERVRLLACSYESMAAATQSLLESVSRCSGDALSTAVDDCGYNMLQQAVAKDDVAFVKLLLQVGCNPNDGHCSRPLHLAALTGKPDLVVLLLKAGARSSARCGMCFPQPHVDGYASYAKFFFINHQSPCAGHEKDAIQTAIEADHAEVLEAFYNNDPQCLRGKGYLHGACESGARRCVRFLVETVRPLGLRERDSLGYTPLERCLRGAGDAELARYLADCGADVSQPAAAGGSGGVGGGGGCCRGPTALHVLFELDSAGADLAAKTRLVLGLGVEASASVRDEQGNAPLHRAACLFADRVGQWRAGGCEARVPLDALAAVRLLLRHNADPTVVDSEQQLPLLRILVAAHDCLVGRNGAADAAGDGTTKRHCEARRLLDGVCSVAGDFVANRFSVNAPLTGDGVTVVCFVVDLLLAWWLRVDALDRAAAVRMARSHIELLTSRGADLNVRFKGRRGIVSLLAAHARRVLAIVDEHCREQAAAFLDEFMVLLFERGLDPNGRNDNCTSEEESMHVNALSAFVGMLQEPAVKRLGSSAAGGHGGTAVGGGGSSRLVALCSWLRTVLVWGGDPDLEPYRADPVICTSQANIFLKAAASHPVQHLVQEMCDGPWLDDEDAAAAVGTMIRLLVSCMSHEPLAKALDSSGGGSSIGSSMRSLLTRCSSCVGGRSWAPAGQLGGLGAVRSLKQLSRVAVMAALHRRTAQHADQLSLPPRLKRYLLLLDH